MKEYALYKGEDILAIGTVREIAKMQGIKEDTVRYYHTPANRRKEGKFKNRRVLIRLETEHDNN